ncbi:MAG: hypothetical protein M3Y24_10785 [Acidobacteriota bacterium]|nr:hypothetical protein [Acidobacteriota bacterium]
MLRALIDLLVMISVVLIARAVLNSVLGGISRASSKSFGGQAQASGKRWAEPQSPGNLGGDLHKDPVCGTYVAESTALRRQAGGQTFYYCSENCREKHSFVAK